MDGEEKKPGAYDKDRRVAGRVPMPRKVLYSDSEGVQLPREGDGHGALSDQFVGYGDVLAADVDIMLASGIQGRGSLVAQVAVKYLVYWQR